MERLVVGIDGSDSARAALRWALSLAEALRPSQRPVNVDVVRVLAEAPRAALGLPSHVPPSMVDERRREAEDELAALAVEVDPDGGRQVTARVLDGDPGDVLLDLARDADLLVLGSSHLGRVSGAVLGSVAQRCIAEAAAPVVIVPSTDAADVGGA